VYKREKRGEGEREREEEKERKRRERGDLIKSETENVDPIF
jgi:hypothetical protein